MSAALSPGLWRLGRIDSRRCGRRVRVVDRTRARRLWDVTTWVRAALARLPPAVRTSVLCVGEWHDLVAILDVLLFVGMACERLQLVELLERGQADLALLLASLAVGFGLDGVEPHLLCV